MQLADLGSSSMIMDMASTFAGTPLFMAPEMLNKETHNVQTDIYSLGCLAYMLCMLKHPFMGTDVVDLHTKIAAGTDFQEIPSYMFSSELIYLVCRMLSRDVARRPTADEICNPQGWLFKSCMEDADHFHGHGRAFQQEMAARKSKAPTGQALHAAEQLFVHQIPKNTNITSFILHDSAGSSISPVAGDRQRFVHLPDAEYTTKSKLRITDIQAPKNVPTRLKHRSTHIQSPQC